MNKNLIKEIYFKPGFRSLTQLSFDDNLISTWKTFDELNQFESMISQIRCQNNPITQEKDDSVKRAKQIAISRMQFLKKYNGTRVEDHERRDFEIFYLKIAYEEYLEKLVAEKGDKGAKVDSLEDPDLA